MRAGRGCLEYEGVFNLAEFFSLNYDNSSIFIVDPKDGDSSYTRDFVLEPHALIQRVVSSCSTPAVHNTCVCVCVCVCVHPCEH